MPSNENNIINERVRLRQFLNTHFNLEELEDLVFDLGPDFQFISSKISGKGKGEIIRNLIEYFEHWNQLRCLWDEVLKHRPLAFHNKRLEKLPPCILRTKIGIRSPFGGVSVNLEEANSVIAAFLGVPLDDVKIVTVGRGSLRLLVNVPERAARRINLSNVFNLGSNWNQVTVTHFDKMDLVTRETWRLVALNYPPRLMNGVIHPTISWQEAVHEQTIRNLRPKLFTEIDPEPWDDPENIMTDQTSPPRAPKNAKEKLSYYLLDLWQIKGFSGSNFQELADGSFGLTIFIGTKQVTFFYDVSGIEPMIIGIILRNSREETRNVPNPGLYNTFSLLEAIQRLEDRFGRDKPGSEKDWL